MGAGVACVCMSGISGEVKCAGQTLVVWKRIPRDSGFVITHRPDMTSHSTLADKVGRGYKLTETDKRGDLSISLWYE